MRWWIRRAMRAQRGPPASRGHTRLHTDSKRVTMPTAAQHAIGRGGRTVSRLSVPSPTINRQPNGLQRLCRRASRRRLPNNGERITAAIRVWIAPGGGPVPTSTRVGERLVGVGCGGRYATRTPLGRYINRRAHGMTGPLQTGTEPREGGGGGRGGPVGRAGALGHGPGSPRCKTRAMREHTISLSRFKPSASATDSSAPGNMQGTAEFHHEIGRPSFHRRIGL